MSDAAPNFMRMTRRFEASAERVFDAWVDKAFAAKWLFTSPMSEAHATDLDARVGGKWTIADTRDGVVYTAIGEYLEIDRPRRLVFSFGMPQFGPGFARVIIEIVVDGEGCVQTLTQEDVPAGSEDAIERGWNEMFDALGGLLI